MALRKEYCDFNIYNFSFILYYVKNFNFVIIIRLSVN